MAQQVHQLFKQAMDRHGIQGKELAALVGISQNHLSEFRNGKKWISPEVFSALLQGMDQIAPGSRKYFCQLLADEPLVNNNGNNGNKTKTLIDMIENANDDDIEAVLLAIGRKWKESRQSVVNTNDRVPQKFNTTAVV